MKAKNNKSPKLKKRVWLVLCMFSILILVAIVIGSVAYCQIKVLSIEKLLQKSEEQVYEKYYVLITSDSESLFWKSVSAAAKEAAKEKGAYLDFWGNMNSKEYTQEQLMRIAIESAVDGIIVEDNNSSKMKDLIDEAVKKKIPVVTAVNDCSSSKRKSFIGINSYALGHEYGNQVVKLANQLNKSSIHVVLLMGEGEEEQGQNLVYRGIQEVIDQSSFSQRDITVKQQLIENHSAFAAEESIRDLCKSKETADIIICMDELFTTCAYQAVVDYNMVGKINILGYYQSDTILNAIKKQVIYSTISVDTKQMGQSCIHAMTEYETTGYVSEYLATDTILINENNVSGYLRGTNENDEENH